MNRHFIYSALPVEVLGTPIRQEPTKGSPETPWKPMSGHPDYLERINPQGIREVSHRDHVPVVTVGQVAALAEVALRPFSGRLISVEVVAPTEWQSGPPPSAGWFNAQDGYDRSVKYDRFARYWTGARWSGECSISDWETAKHGALRRELTPDTRDGMDHDIRWRGHRLTGADWPEPQS